MKRSKNDEEQFYDYEYEHSGDEKKLTEDSCATIITPTLTDHSAVSPNRATEPKDDIPDRYTGKETNIFGDSVGVNKITKIINYPPDSYSWSAVDLLKKTNAL